MRVGVEVAVRWRKKLRSLGLERGYASGLRLHAQSVGGVWAGEVAIHGQHFAKQHAYWAWTGRWQKITWGPW